MLNIAHWLLRVDLTVQRRNNPFGQGQSRAQRRADGVNRTAQFSGIRGRPQRMFQWRFWRQQGQIPQRIPRHHTCPEAVTIGSFQLYRVSFPDHMFVCDNLCSAPQGKGGAQEFILAIIAPDGGGGLYHSCG